MTSASLPLLRDLAAAAALGVATVVGTAVVAPSQGLPFGAVGVAACVAAAAAWCWHRPAPVVAALVAVAAVAVAVAAGEPYGPVQLVVALLCATVGRARPVGVTAAVCAAATAVLAAALGIRGDGDAVTVLLAWPAVFAVVPGMAGALARARAEAGVRAMAGLLAAGAYEERLRMAREVHDIAGHGFAVVAMQAGVALTVLDDDRPGSVRTFLEAVRDTSERALAELQATLDVVEGAAPPGARDVPALVERVRAGGLPVELRVAGEPGDLGPEVSTTVYRIVQEALTNVVRHAGPTVAGVTIQNGAAQVSVRVADRGTGGGGTGRGLSGLRRRVEGLGGSFAAAERGSGGFEVAAVLPGGAR